MHLAVGRTAMPFLLVATLIFPGALGCSREEERTQPQTSSVDVQKTIDRAKKSIEQLRRSLPASKDTKIEVLDAKALPVPGLVELTLRAKLENRTAVRKVIVSDDLRYVFRGVLVPLGEIPRERVELENVNLKDSPMRGNPKAPVTIVEFGDFQCPFCRAAQPNLDRILKEYEGKVRVVFKHYPLVSLHPWALEASMLAECARRQKPELFWKLHDFYYNLTTAVTPGTILKTTQEALKGQDLNMDKFNECFLKKQTQPKVERDYKEGLVVGVQGTPVFLVNDIFLSGDVQYEILNALVLEELRHTETGTRGAAGGPEGKRG